MKTIGNKIKELRHSNGMSQKDMADALGITSQAVSKWENDNGLPEMSMLPEIAALLGIQIDDLFEYSTEKRYESICKKIEYGRSMTNAEFAQDECFLISEIETNPTNYEALSLLGDLYRYYANKLNEKSVHYAKAALTIKPNQKNDINNINNASGGKLFDWDVSNHEKLINCYYNLLKVEPKNTKIYFYLIDNLLDGGRITEAKEVLEEAIIKAPDNVNDYYMIHIREKQFGFEAVKAEYEALAEKYAEDWRVLFSIANSYSLNEHYESAIVMWQACFDHMEKPRFTDPFEAMAQCARMLGKKDLAISFYKKELKLLKEDWDFHYGSQVDEINNKIQELS